VIYFQELKSIDDLFHFTSFLSGDF